MSIQTNSIASFIRDTEHNIKNLSRGLTNTWAVAVDTGAIFLIKNNALYQWSSNANKIRGSYQYTPEIKLPYPAWVHVDASDSDTIVGASGVLGNNTRISRVKNKATTGIENFFPNTGSCLYKTNAFGTQPGIELSGDGRLISDLDEHVHDDGLTIFMVFKLLPTFDSYDGDNATLDSRAPNHVGLFSDKSYSNPDNYGSGPWSYLYMRENTNDNTGIDWYYQPLGEDSSATDQVGEITPYVLGKGNGIYYSPGNDSNQFDPLGVENGNNTIVSMWRYGTQTHGLKTAFPVRTSEWRINGWSRGRTLNGYGSPNMYGMQIGGYPNGNPISTGGHYVVGEFIAIRDFMSNDYVNTIGSTLANKWGGYWDTSV